MARLGGRTVLDHAADRLMTERVAARLAVVGTTQKARRQLLKSRGYEVLDNPDPARGQGTSLAIGVAHIRDHTTAEAVIIQLADMPRVEDAHLGRLAAGFQAGADAVISASGGVQSPPALFTRPLFDALASLTGDHGALGVFRSCSTGISIEMPDREGLDIDTCVDLKRARTE